MRSIINQLRTNPNVPGRFLENLRYSGPEHLSLGARALARVIDLRHLGWDLGLRAMERAAGLRHGAGERLDVRLGSSVRDLIAEKGRVVRGEVDALVDAVMRAGSYPAREEATRAIHAVLDGARDRVPPEVLAKLSDYLPEAEAARLRASLEDRRTTP